MQLMLAQLCWLSFIADKALAAHWETKSRSRSAVFAPCLLPSLLLEQLLGCLPKGHRTGLSCSAVHERKDAVGMCCSTTTGYLLFMLNQT